MKTINFTPGPSQLYPTVPHHIRTALQEEIGSLSHRGKIFEELFLRTVDSLKTLLSIPSDYHVVFLSSATEGMERIVQNCVEQESFHFINGAFSQKFHDISKSHYKKTQSYTVDIQKPFDYHNAFIPQSAEVIAVTQNETSNGWTFLENDIHALKAKNPNSLIAVDIVSSVPYVNLDFAKVDVVFFSVQKGFGLPAGLGVLIMSPQAYEKSLYMHKNKSIIGSYHTFPTLIKHAQIGQTPETPNVLGIYLFEKVLRDIHKIGLSEIRAKTEQKAQQLYTYLNASDCYIPLITPVEHRSKTVIVVKGKEKLSVLHEKLKTKSLVVGNGYGEEKDTQIRIANFPTHTPLQIAKLLKYF
jgi:phosphoserine aminotransferase